MFEKKDCRGELDVGGQFSSYIEGIKVIEVSQCSLVCGVTVVTEAI